MPKRAKPKLTEADFRAARTVRRMFLEKQEREDWTQKDLAAAYGEGNKGTPVTQGAMSQYMSGRTRIGVVATLKFARIFEVQPTEIRPDFKYNQVTASELPVDVLQIASKLALYSREARRDIAKELEVAIERRAGRLIQPLIKGIAMAYRRRKGSDTWHWCRNCNNWPTSNYDERQSRPDHDLCNECKAKEKEGRCTT